MKFNHDIPKIDTSCRLYKRIPRKKKKKISNTKWLETMKYRDQIDKLWEDALRDPGMSDCEWATVKMLMESHPNYNMQKFEEDIEIGIKNGYSLDDQLRICRDIIQKMKI